jgi:hypothetical protein
MKINENMKASDPCKTQKSRSAMILPFEKDRMTTSVYAAFKTQKSRSVMIFPFEKDLMTAPIDDAFIDRLKQIYAAMDRVYHRAPLRLCL